MSMLIFSYWQSFLPPRLLFSETPPFHAFTGSNSLDIFQETMAVFPFPAAQAYTYFVPRASGRYTHSSDKSQLL